MLNVDRVLGPFPGDNDNFFDAQGAGFSRLVLHDRCIPANYPVLSAVPTLDDDPPGHRDGLSVNDLVFGDGILEGPTHQLERPRLRTLRIAAREIEE